MARIKIKCRQKTKEQKLNLIEILCTRDIEINRVFSTNDGFVVLTLNEYNADLIFQSDIKNEL